VSLSDPTGRAEVHHPSSPRRFTSIVAETVKHVVGIDTHARTHTYRLVHARTATVVDTATFPTSKSGNARAISWITRRSQGRVLAAVEGTGPMLCCLAGGVGGGGDGEDWQTMAVARLMASDRTISGAEG
jgi:hypothetical protein